MDKLFLNNIEFDITDRCNLNCASCNHFSNFATTYKEYDVNEFESDVKRLSELFIIRKLKLVGGEPFLYSKDLIILIDIMLKYFPDSGILVYTNGALVNKIKELKSKLDANSNKYGRVRIFISEYPNKESELSKSDSFGHGKRPNFRFIDLNFDGNSDPTITRTICGCENCPSVYNGKLYICPITKNFNLVLDYFKLDVGVRAEDMGCDIHNHSAQYILDYMNNFDRGLYNCRFCGYHRGNKP